MMACNDPRYVSEVKSIIRGYAFRGLVPMSTINDIQSLKTQGGLAFIKGVPPLLAAAGVDPLPPCITPFSGNIQHSSTPSNENQVSKRKQ